MTGSRRGALRGCGRAVATGTGLGAGSARLAGFGFCCVSVTRVDGPASSKSSLPGSTIGRMKNSTSNACKRIEAAYASA